MAEVEKDPYPLRHTADEIDEKLVSIPVRADSIENWTRHAEWKRIADQVYDDKSEFAQSGLAVAAAITAAEARIDKKISDSISVDTEFDGTSTRAQSGTAVKAAFDQALSDTGSISAKITKALSYNNANITDFVSAITDNAILDMFNSDEENNNAD